MPRIAQAAARNTLILAIEDQRSKVVLRDVKRSVGGQMIEAAGGQAKTVRVSRVGNSRLFAQAGSRSGAAAKWIANVNLGGRQSFRPKEERVVSGLSK